jgi:uncharacterized protein
MRYNVSQLLKEPIGSTRSYQVEEVFTDPERCADQASGSVQLLRTHQGILANAELNVKVRLDCGRCLDPFTFHFVLRIEEDFVPLVDVNTGQRLPAPASWEGSRIDASHILDLTDIFRQGVITYLPMKQLCDPDCSGLCQWCGTNLNQRICECSSAGRDPRWSGLADLLQRQS